MVGSHGSSYTIHKVLSGARRECEVCCARRLLPKGALLAEKTTVFSGCGWTLRSLRYSVRNFVCQSKGLQCQAFFSINFVFIEFPVSSKQKAGGVSVKFTQEDKEELQEVAASLADANEVSIDVAVAAV